MVRMLFSGVRGGLQGVLVAMVVFEERSGGEGVVSGEGFGTA
jgi:hypothetical protein